MNETEVPFGIYYAAEAFSTAKKIMGRQSAGKAFMAGIARTWPTASIKGVGIGGNAAAQSMMRQLAADGFRGSLHWHELPHWKSMSAVGCIYYPSPVHKELAFARNQVDPGLFSWLGVTFTLSSGAALDQIADLILPPFKPWDALICISEAGRSVVSELHQEMREWWMAQAGVQRFNTPQLPVIPLGVDLQAFYRAPGQRAVARAALGIEKDEVAFLFAGRLSFHAKANPAPMYQALENAARTTRITCIEAGVFPNDDVRKAYAAAQHALAPSVRFIWADGRDSQHFEHAWKSADVFISLADNVQETFGLTPIEAMAAGLPIIVSDWDGYKENISDGVEGFRIPTTLPPPGVGKDLAQWHGLTLQDYDYYVGRTSLATVIDPRALTRAVTELATRPDLRRKMGAAGFERVKHQFDWSVILQSYASLAEQLNDIRRAAGTQTPEPWSTRADPFARFGSFSSHQLRGEWRVAVRPEARPRFAELLKLSVANYAFHPELLPEEAVIALLDKAVRDGESSVNGLFVAAGQSTPVGVRALMWLWKFDLISVYGATP